MEKHILIVEDENDIASALAIRLKNEGFKVTIADNGIDGSDIAKEQLFDLAILDIMLPGKNGLEIANQLKETSTSVLILSAKDEEQDIVKGLNIGADDYVTKPFSIREVVARVNAILRRQSQIPSQNVDRDFEFGELVIDSNKHRVLLKSKDIHATATEYRLLMTLCLNIDRVLTREELVELVLNSNDSKENEKNIRTIDSHIRSLRKKIGPQYIKTVHGVGYLFEPSNEITKVSA